MSLSKHELRQGSPVNVRRFTRIPTSNAPFDRYASLVTLDRALSLHVSPVTEHLQAAGRGLRNIR
jgi:hypothetical protein